MSNRYFGPSVTIAGLLAGEDIADALGPCDPADVIVLPAEALNADDVFIDGVSLDELRTRLGVDEVRTGYDLVDALGRA